MNDNLPCPFCLERQARAIRPSIHPGNASLWTIYCMACRASGPWAQSAEAARVAWEAVRQKESII